MDFVKEDIIEASVKELGQAENNIKIALEELEIEQPVIASYIFSENHNLLTQPEKEFFLFLILTIYKSIKKVNPHSSQITEEKLGGVEESNWAVLNEVKSKLFRERMDIFFENYFQEDLLAFVEDSLTEDEEEIVTKVGREPMFVALKSIIDTLCD